MQHELYMQHALTLAEKGRLTVSPNPMVGCVIVKNNKIVGEGFHELPGQAHAEIAALQQAGENARDATMYVSLEPCCHHGRTPPCTDAIIQSDIKEVYAACTDNNPKVASKGIEQLRQAGIKVHLGICEKQARKLNEIYFHYMQYNKPFVIAKWAMSLDGKTITHPEDERQISGKQSQQEVFAWRNIADAILIGANTARRDNPLLTSRLKHISLLKHPIKIILSSEGNLPDDLNIFSEKSPAKNILVTSVPLKKALNNTEILMCEGSAGVGPPTRAACEHDGVTDVAGPAPTKQKNSVSIKDLLTELGKRGISSLLVEGGMQTLEEFYAQDLVNKTQVYIAPCIIGKNKKKHFFKHTHFKASGEDICLVAS